MEEKSLEARLIEKGVKLEDLDYFARLPLHNAKKDVFRRIAGATRLEDLDRYSKGPFLRNLMLVLAELGRENWAKFFPESNQTHLGSAAGQLVAVRMLRTLNISGKYQQYGYVTLDRIYHDTFGNVIQVGI